MCGNLNERELNLRELDERKLNVREINERELVLKLTALVQYDAARRGNEAKI